MEIVITKTYNVHPYCKSYKLTKSKANGRKRADNIIYIGEINFHYGTEIPLSSSQCVHLKSMLKSGKTDILTLDNGHFYAFHETKEAIVRITHPRIK